MNVKGHPTPHNWLQHDSRFGEDPLPVKPSEDPYLYSLTYAQCPSSSRSYSFERLYLPDGLPSGMENSLALCGRKAAKMENYYLDSYACVQQLASLAMSKQQKGEEMEKIDAFRHI